MSNSHSPTHVRMVSNKSPKSSFDQASPLATKIASPNAVHQTGSNVREKVRSIQHQVSNQQIQIDSTNVQLKKLHRSLDPLRISMKRYTDQCETRIREDVDTFIAQKQKQLEKAFEQIEVLGEQNLALEAKNLKCEQSILELSRCIEQLQTQVFANYDESESILMPNNKFSFSATSVTADGDENNKLAANQDTTDASENQQENQQESKQKQTVTSNNQLSNLND